jgi:hypothetical protein
MFGWGDGKRTREKQKKTAERRLNFSRPEVEAGWRMKEVLRRI